MYTTTRAYTAPPIFQTETQTIPLSPKMDNDRTQQPTAPISTPVRRATITATSTGHTGFVFRGTSEPLQSESIHEARWEETHLSITTRPVSPAALSNESDYVQDVDEGRPTIEDRLIPVWEIFHVQSTRWTSLICLERNWMQWLC